MVHIDLYFNRYRAEDRISKNEVDNLEVYAQHHSEKGRKHMNLTLRVPYDTDDSEMQGYANKMADKLLELYKRFEIEEHIGEHAPNVCGALPEKVENRKIDLFEGVLEERLRNGKPIKFIRRNGIMQNGKL
jgi:hypothetical protein